MIVLDSNKHEEKAFIESITDFKKRIENLKYIDDTEEIDIQKILVRRLEEILKETSKFSRSNDDFERKVLLGRTFKKSVEKLKKFYESKRTTNIIQENSLTIESILMEFKYLKA